MECPCCNNPALLPKGLDVPKYINVPLTFIRRLEAATSRLEDMVPTMSAPSGSTNGIASLPESGLTAPGAVVQNGPSSSQTQLAVAPLPPAIDDFDALINGDVKTFVNMSEEVGGLVAEQVRVDFKAQKANTYIQDSAKYLLVSCGTSSVCRGAKVFDRHYKSKETRYPIARVHGGTERSTIDDGHCERH